MKDYEAFQTLFNYQAATTSKDYANANGYYQLGLISQKMMRQYDPFLQSENVAQCIANAKTYFSLAKHYLDAKEARKNGAYYQATPEPRTFESITKDIVDRAADVLEYKTYFERNLEYLKTGILRYNACIETFGKINAQNSRLNDLYFLADNQLKKNLKDLQVNFDSTLYYLDRFKRSLEEYPMGGYTISYSLLPVPVYRLHGLTSSNFIEKNVKLWDFRSWIDSFNVALNTDVAFLYQQAEDVHKENLDRIARLARADKTDSVSDYTINPLVINKIYKYDFNSVVAPLLIYQEEKIRFLAYNADNAVDRHLYAVNNYAKSNSYYYELAMKKLAADSALSVTSSKAVPEALKKYQTFFEKNYKDYAGFQSYLKSEAADNDLIMRSALDHYKDNIFKPVSIGVIKYGDDNLYTTLVTPDKTGASGYFIHSKSVMSDRRTFVTGSYVSGLETLAFAALLNRADSIIWLKTFDRKEGRSRGVLAAHSDNGFMTVVSTDNTIAITNEIYLLDVTGNVKNSVKLEAATVPRKLMYDDISETFLIAFKGRSYASYGVDSDALSMYLLDSNLTRVWNTSLQFTGYLSNVIRTNNRFYVYGAYSKIKDASEKETVTEDERINAFVYTADAMGKWLSLKTFDAPFSYYPLLVSKISNEYVDMICAKDKPELTDVKGSAYYLIISSANEAYYKSE
jgi:hypothetical protein